MATFEEIQRRGMAKLYREAEQFVPVKEPTLYQMYREGRLIARGRPLTVELDHLREQFFAGFPLVNQEKPEPTTT